MEIFTSFRTDGSLASVCFWIVEGPLSVKLSNIYAVTFPDALMSATRVPVHSSHLPPKSVTGSVEAEAAIFKRLQTSGFMLSPWLIGYDSNVDNPIGFLYMVLSWIKREPLKGSDEVLRDRKSRKKIIGHMVDIAADWGTCAEVGRTVASYCFLISSSSI